MADYLPEKIESRCHVCQSDLRLIIDTMGSRGFRASFIAKEVQDIDPSLSRKSIERHLTRHVNYENKALQQILQQRAKEEGILTNAARENILTRQAVLDQFVAQTWKRVSQPDAKIPFEVGLKAIELQEMLEQKQESNIVETVTRQLAAIIQAIREVVPAEYHEDLARRAEHLFDAPALGELPAGIAVDPESPGL
jgi:predicted RNA-binding protein YlxR (DUF448 family)